MAFDFDEAIKKQAFDRQQRKCAFCGNPIAKGGYQVHHVIPKQLGNAKDPSHKMIGTAKNAVALCVSFERNCHANVHEGDKYKNGTVPFPDQYKWSHGGEASLHKRWHEELTVLFNSIFDSIAKANVTGQGTSRQ